MHPLDASPRRPKGGIVIRLITNLVAAVFVIIVFFLFAVAVVVRLV